MKKFLLVLVVALSMPLVVLAKGFEPQVKVTGNIGVDSYKNNSFGADFVAGYRVTDMFRVGIGVGISYVDLFFEDGHFIENHWYGTYKESAAYVPVFVDCKLNLTSGKISPHVNLDLGYAAYIPFSGYAKKNQLGFFVQPAFGVDFNLGKGALFVQVGYKYQMRKCDYWVNTNGNYSQVSLAIGYQF